VLHGPRGSGRTTLIREALTAARRQGLQVVGALDEPLSRRPGGPPSVIALDGNRPDHVELVGRILGDDLPWLVLIRADEPLPSLISLGSRQVKPSPLDRESIAVLLEHYNRPPGEAEALLASTGGLPGSVRARIQAVTQPHRSLNRLQRGLVNVLGDNSATLSELARKLGIGEPELIDIVEPLIDKGLIERGEGGLALARPNQV
jgi:hypothetical protein